MFFDCIGRTVVVGDRLGVAFSAGGSSGRIRAGRVESLEPEFRMKWYGGEISPPLRYRPDRVIRL